MMAETKGRAGLRDSHATPSQTRKGMIALNRLPCLVVCQAIAMPTAHFQTEYTVEVRSCREACACSAC